MTRFPRLPLLALVVLSIIWGYSWVFFKLGLRDAGPFTFAGLRTFLGALSLLLVLFAAGRSLRLTRGREVLLLGLVNTTASIACSQWALLHGPANRTSVLMYTMPFWTLLIAWPALGERVRGAQWLAITCAGAGLVIVIQPWALQGHGAANASILAAALLWSLGSILTKRILARAPYDLLALTGWQLLFGSFGLLALASLAQEPPAIWTPRFIGALCATALVSTAFGWVVWAYLLNRLPAGMASMMTLLTPVVAVASTSWQLGESLAPSDVTGMALILGGLVILSVRALGRHLANATA